jgi:hypothetical protein
VRKKSWKDRQVLPDGLVDAHPVQHVPRLSDRPWPQGPCSPQRSIAQNGVRLAARLQPGHGEGVIPAEPVVLIRPRRWGLVFMVGWIGFLCLLMVLGSIGEQSARGLFLVFVWLPWLVPVMLIARSRVTIAGDTLTYRSPMGTAALTAYRR